MSIVFYILFNEILRGFHAFHSMATLKERGPEAIFDDADWNRFNRTMSAASIFMYTFSLVHFMVPVVFWAIHLGQELAQSGLYILWMPLTLGVILIGMACRAVMYHFSAPLHKNDFFAFVLLSSLRAQ